MSEFNACGESIPWISPRDWLKFIVDRGLWHRLAGLSDADRHLSPMVWKQFWDHYKTLNPDFSLFSMENVDYGNMAALFVHGDEGRMLKKSGIMIIYCPTVCPGFWLRREAHEKGSQWFVCATSELCWPHLYNANGHQCHIKALA